MKKYLKKNEKNILEIGCFGYFLNLLKKATSKIFMV